MVGKCGAVGASTEIVDIMPLAANGDIYRWQIFMTFLVNTYCWHLFSRSIVVCPRLLSTSYFWPILWTSLIDVHCWHIVASHLLSTHGWHFVLLTHCCHLVSTNCWQLLLTHYRHLLYSLSSHTWPWSRVFHRGTSGRARTMWHWTQPPCYHSIHGQFRTSL